MEPNRIFVRISEILRSAKWADLECDTVLNVWLQRTQHFAPGEGMVWDWPRLTADAQGDAKSLNGIDASVEQALRQSLPRGVSGVTFRADLSAGGRLDVLFHGMVYEWNEAGSSDELEALNDAILKECAAIAWPELSERTVLNFTIVREAPAVSEASLRCEWLKCTVDAQGDSKAAETGLSDRLGERLVALLADNVSAVSFRLSLSERGEIEGRPFHTRSFSWRAYSQVGCASTPSW